MGERAMALGSRPRRVARAAVPCGGGMDWSSLPADLLYAVFALLPSDADRVRFGAVCAGWGAAAASWRPRPWLVGSRTDRSGRGAAMSSFWLSRGDSDGDGGCSGSDGCGDSCGGGGLLVPFAAAVPPGFEYLSSSHGYLALGDPRASAKAITLVNPISGRLIRLPPIGFFKKWHDVATVVLSADPDTADEWAVMAVGFPTNCLAYYSSAAGTWTPLGFNVAGYAGVEHYKGRFYVAFKPQLCVCEVDAAVPAVIPLEQINGDGLDNDEATGKHVVETHLLECAGALLLVSVHDNSVYDSDTGTGIGGAGADGRGRDARAVEVHRVVWVADGRVRLVRENDLGDYAVFLGRNRAFALSPEEFPACRANCVYLVDQQGHPDGLVRVLDLNAVSWWDRKIHPEDGKQGSPSPSAGWARRGWFFPKF